MPYAHHSDPEKKWTQQFLTTKHHILPFLQEHWTTRKQARVLEVGCGEGGVLKAFADNGYRCYGIDISASRIESGKELLKTEVNHGQVSLFSGDIHDDSKFSHLYGIIDLLVLKDAIEHIHEQQKILRVLQRFLAPGGFAFFAFPPWLNPFGGHQQLADSFLRFVPWFHILPKPVYRGILNVCGETPAKIDGLMEIYDTRLSTQTFENLLNRAAWEVKIRQFYLFNPGYEFKFGIKPRKQVTAITRVPGLRDVISTAVYYLATVKSVYTDELPASA